VIMGEQGAQQGWVWGQGSHWAFWVGVTMMWKCFRI
jgi:hypothetical protein